MSKFINAPTLTENCYLRLEEFKGYVPSKRTAIALAIALEKPTTFWSVRYMPSPVQSSSTLM